MSVELTLDQARSVFEQLAQLKAPQNQNAKLCFSSTQLWVESDSKTWRTAASNAHYYLPGYVCSRDLKSLYPMVQEAAECFFKSAEVPKDSSKDISIECATKTWKSAQEIRAAREGPEALKNNKYAMKPEKAKLIDKSIEILDQTEGKIKKPIREWLGPKLLKDETQDIMTVILIHLKEENKKLKHLKEENEKLKHLKVENERLKQRLYDALYDEK